MSTLKTAKAIRELLLNQQRRADEAAISSRSQSDCSASGCEWQIADITDFGAYFLRTCRRPGKYRRWGRRYCKQHARKAKKPVVYGEKQNAGLERLAKGDK